MLTTKKTTRRTILILTIGSLLLLGILWFWYSGVPRPHLYDPMPASPAARDTLVLTLLKQKLEDNKSWEARATGVAGSHLGQLVSGKFWDRLYPVAYAEPILLTYGSDIVDPLIRIMNDPAQEERIRNAAAEVLAWFDDPRILQAYRNAARAGRVNPFVLVKCFCHYLPLHAGHPKFPILAGRQVTDWLEENADKGYVELALSLLDSLIEYGLLFGDLTPLRWLDRLYDVDFDEWLAKNAPDALAFREAHLQRGYDPAVAFYVFRINLIEGIIDEGIKKTFSQPADRLACRQLIQAVFNAGASASAPPVADGWEHRLRTWYRENRRFLVYDFDKHRFVVRKPATAASQPSSQPDKGERQE